MKQTELKLNQDAKKITVNWHAVSLLEGFPGGSAVKNPPGNAADVDSVPVSGRSPGGGNGNPLQNSCQENFMDGGTWQATGHGVAKCWTQLSD